MIPLKIYILIPPKKKNLKVITGGLSDSISRAFRNSWLRADKEECVLFLPLVASLLDARHSFRFFLFLFFLDFLKMLHLLHNSWVSSLFVLLKRVSDLLVAPDQLFLKTCIENRTQSENTRFQNSPGSALPSASICQSRWIQCQIGYLISQKTDIQWD